MSPPYKRRQCILVSFPAALTKHRAGQLQKRKGSFSSWFQRFHSIDIGYAEPGPVRDKMLWPSMHVNSDRTAHGRDKAKRQTNGEGLQQGKNLAQQLPSVTCLLQ